MTEVTAKLEHRYSDPVRRSIAMYFTPNDTAPYYRNPPRQDNCVREGFRHVHRTSG